MVQQELARLHNTRLKVHAHCQLAEEGKTSSSFFCNLASSQRNHQSMRSIRDLATGQVHHDPFEILGVWRCYYDMLFTAQECDPVVQDEILQKLTCQLSEAEHAR